MSSLTPLTPTSRWPWGGHVTRLTFVLYRALWCAPLRWSFSIFTFIWSQVVVEVWYCVETPSRFFIFLQYEIKWFYKYCNDSRHFHTTDFPPHLNLFSDLADHDQINFFLSIRETLYKPPKRLNDLLITCRKQSTVVKNTKGNCDFDIFAQYTCRMGKLLALTDIVGWPEIGFGN